MVQKLENRWNPKLRPLHMQPPEKVWITAIAMLIEEGPSNMVYEWHQKIENLAYAMSTEDALDLIESILRRYPYCITELDMYTEQT